MKSSGKNDEKPKQTEENEFVEDWHQADFLPEPEDHEPDFAMAISPKVS